MIILSWRAIAAGLTLAIGAGAAGAQASSRPSSPIGEGAWIVSGSAGVAHSSQDGQPGTTNVFVSPSALYFFWPKLALGGNVGASYSHSRGATAKSFGIGPEIRYFPADLAAKTLPFVRAAVRPTWQWTDVSAFPNQSSTRQVQWEVGAGLTQLLATHVGLTGEAYYTQTHAHFDNGGTPAQESNLSSTSYGLRFGITAFVF